MADTFAYHIAVHSLEARSGLTPLARFTLALHHAMSGHLHYSRAFDAARESKRRGTSLGQIEASVAQWVETDLNPMVQTAKCMNSSAEAIRWFNAYNRSAPLGIRTTVGERAGSWKDMADISSAATRVRTGLHEDLECSRATAFAILGDLIRRAEAHGRAGLDVVPRTVADVAFFFGVESSAAAEVCAVFEAEGSMRVAHLARHLGASQRSLERKLRTEGVTAESLRSATRLVRATARLKTQESLTTIAVAEGYSDSAHMSRAFQASCGMTPSMLRQFHRGLPPT